MSTPEPSPAPASAAAPLRLPRFRRIWIAQTTLNTGHYLQGVAAAWVMVEMTNSPLWVGIAVAAPLVPNLALSLVAGAMADLVDRRRLLVASSAIMAIASLTIGALYAIGWLDPLRLVLLELVLGVGLALFAPAWQASVANTVPVGLVPGAVALNSASGAVATAIGPALGGAILALSGPAWAFAAGALGYASMVVVLAPLREAPWRDDQGPLAPAILTGIRHVRHTAVYRSVLVTIALFGLTSAALRALLPSLVADTFDGAASLYGLLLGLLGLGALCGAVTRPRAAGWLGDRLVPASIVGFGVLGLVLGATRSTALAAATVLLSGVLWTWIIATANATMQMLSPAWVRGRTMSMFMLAFGGFTPLGALAAGGLGDLLGASESLLVCSAAVVLAGGYAWRAALPTLLVHTEEGDTVEADGSTDGDVGQPVVVTVRWRVHPQHQPTWIAAMQAVRTNRLGAGARAWRLHRDADDASVYTETFRLATWAECHQHSARLGRTGREALTLAARLDVRGAPTTRVGLPVELSTLNRP